MPESPDFDTMAVEALLSTTALLKPDDVVWYVTVKNKIAEQLRLVWNARGAADLKLRTAVETVLEKFTRDEAQGYHSRDRQYAIEILGRALDAVDPSATSTGTPSTRDPTA